MNLKYKLSICWIVLIIILGITISLLVVPNIAVDGNTVQIKEDAVALVNGISETIKTNNGIINLKVKDNEYTMWYNSKGETYAVDNNTYYIFRNDGKLIYFGLDQSLNTGDVITDKLDFISQLVQEMKAGSDFSITTSNTNGIINYKTKDKDLRKVEINKLDGNYSINVYTQAIADTVDTNKVQDLMIWGFNGYTNGVDWELAEDWYKADTDKQELLKEFIAYMEDKAKELVSSQCPTVGIKVQDYINSSYSEDIYKQLILDIETLHLEINVSKEELDKSLDSNSNKNQSIFEYYISLG